MPATKKLWQVLEPGNKKMKIKNKYFDIPIIQGGMGVGVSLSKLAGNVAKCGAIGTISSANIGFKEKDFNTNTLNANLRALEREIKEAKEFADGKGLIAVNIMMAVSHYDKACKCAVEAGADVIISGAGLPLNLPEFTKGTNTLCAPIVSSARAARILIKHYKKHYDMVPDLLIIEGSKAGGHLGFSKEELLNGTAKDVKTILKEVKEVSEDIPVFVAGGVFDGTDMAEMKKLGAAGVQIGTRFIATDECDADIRFKQVITDAKAEDIIIIKSPVGMPARAIKTPLLDRIAGGLKFLPNKCNGCLSACPKNEDIPYCISRALIEAVKGNYNDGLFFAGSNAEKINEIVPVAKLISQIMKEYEECTT